MHDDLSDLWPELMYCDYFQSHQWVWSTRNSDVQHSWENFREATPRALDDSCVRRQEKHLLCRLYLRFPTLYSCRAFPLAGSVTRRCAEVTLHCFHTLSGERIRTGSIQKYCLTHIDWASQQCRRHRGLTASPSPWEPDHQPGVEKPARRDPVKHIFLLE